MVLLLAVAAIATLVVLDVVNLEQQIMGITRHAAEAREVAEGSLMEVLGDDQLPTQLASLAADPDLSATYTPSNSSPYNSTGTGQHGQRSYTGSLQMLRVVPVIENRFGSVMGLVYEAQSRAIVNDGEGTAGFAAETYRLVNVQPGYIFPRRHAR